MGNTLESIKTMVLTGYNIVKGIKARPDKPAQLLIYIRNKEYAGQIAQVDKDKWEVELTKKLTQDYKHIESLIKTEKEKNKRIILKSSLKNIANCDIYKITPKLVKKGLYYEPVYICSVKDLIGEIINGNNER